MSINRKLVSSLNPMVETRNTLELKNKTGNLYESISVMSKRANQINITVKEELHRKLQEFANHTDSLEEIQENKEQIEISKFYERMANPALQSLDEFLNNKIFYKSKNDNGIK